ncbi:MAG: ABC transporter ATP-binding protein [Acidobacteria bacterium]|nr:ABC transporter ATP-binding protein [Acidobacteriota bacterium]
MTSVHLNEISAAYGRNRVLAGITLDIAAGEFVALLGPSGCGKTTLLRIIAGLMAPESGDLRFNDESVIGEAAERRRLAMVFQKPLLFPYHNVGDNVAFGLKMKGVARDDRTRRVREALALVQMEDFIQRNPRQLSGGQEQRIALARALVTEPRVLLLDEPFSALDEKLRAEMRSLVKSLQQRLGITTIFVTHDQNEAIVMADRIALLLNGGLEQFAPPRDFYLAPRTESAARFFGWKVWRGELVEESDGLRLKTSIGIFDVPDHAGRPGSVAFRPERLKIKSNKADSLVIEGRIERVTDLGTILRYRLAIDDGDAVDIDLPVDDQMFTGKAGDRLAVEIAISDLRFFD